VNIAKAYKMRISEVKTELNIEKIRADFPILQTSVNGKPLVYLDNGASSQKPVQVINAMRDYYLNEHSNIHRGVHTLSQRATQKYEDARQKVATWLNAKHNHEIIFTRGTTESINLVAHSFGKRFIQAGDEILLSEMEHHSNLVPWQMLYKERGAVLKFVPISDDGDFLLESYKKLLSEKTKLVSITHVSNTLGTVVPVEDIVRLAHAAGAKVLLDGAQAVPHMRIDVQTLDCDFYAFSAHKMYGPTGFGVLYGKENLLNEMPPFMGGGDMIKTVSYEETTYNELPHKFEAGTPAIANGIGMGACIDYLNALDFNAIQRHENALLNYATEKMSEIDDMRFFGTAQHKAGVISFLVGTLHHYDIGVLLDQQGVAVRTGHHCTEPLMHRLGINGTVRASFGMYNSFEEIDIFVGALQRAVRMLS
jgi:cysteine desulfurase / selenocysteine lyase